MSDKEQLTAMGFDPARIDCESIANLGPQELIVGALKATKRSGLQVSFLITTSVELGNDAAQYPI